MDVVEGIVRKDVIDSVEDIVPRTDVVLKVREGCEVIVGEGVVKGDEATEAYGPREPYAPLPGRNNRSCICAVVTSVLE